MSVDSTTCPNCGKPVSAQTLMALCPDCLLQAGLATGTGETGTEGAALFPPPAPEELAPLFPQLEISGVLGRGGMGIVYKVRQKSLNRPAALKLLAPERVGDAGFAARFQTEAHALAAMNHPHIVTVYDFGQAGRFYYLLMEYVDGVNLRQAMMGGRFTPEQALAVVPPVCEALQFAHEHGIVHRDIKPENLLLDKNGGVKIADFGIAKMLGEDATTGIPESPSAGTPQYMAPEQKQHERTDHRADIYSLGVVLYEMLTGELPGGQLQPPSTYLRGLQIDVRLDEVVLRALKEKPELRFQTAAEFRTEVESVVGAAGRGGSLSHLTAADQAQLQRVRWALAGITGLMALGGAVMGMNLPALQAGAFIGTWGILFFVAVAIMVLTAGERMEKVKAARQVALVDSIGILSAVSWCAVLTPALPLPWLVCILAACGYGLACCLLQLANVRPFRSRLFGAPLSPKFDGLGSPIPAFLFAGLGVILGFWTFVLSANPPRLVGWSILGSSLLGIVLAIPVRRIPIGSTSLVVGGISAATWLVVAMAAPETFSGRPMPELVQSETLDLQPDGTARFEMKVATFNGTALTQETTDFNYSSFVHVENVADEQGRPLQFETTPRSWNLIHYTAALHDPVPPGGTFVTISTGTMFGLVRPTGEKDVLEYAMDHHPSYRGVTRRIEVHRLPPGAELVSKITDDLIVKKAGDRIELRIDRMIPANGHILISYRFKLTQTGGASRTNTPASLLSRNR